MYLAQFHEDAMVTKIDIVDGPTFTKLADDQGYRHQGDNCK